MADSNPSHASRPLSLGALQTSGYQSRPVRQELRENLIRRMESGLGLAGRLLGYEDSVFPEIENALLSGHHMVLLGERGQGKSRLIRALVLLLDAEAPIVAGCDLHCDPLAPICGACREKVAEHGDATAVAWVSREERYNEKLATPDVTMADLIGEVDPIKIAEGRHLDDEGAIHFGLVPRAHRGIFAINELPDLMEKIQVGLFNLMEERDVQIRGFSVRLPVDVLVLATANPEDYTSRGRIITPLKDRFDAQIRTHYPRDLATEIAILDQEVDTTPRGGRTVLVPEFMKSIIARLTFAARVAPEINQSSGVSVRVTINNLETLVANAERRAVRNNEPVIVPRISDLPAVAASMLGKVELEYGAEGLGDDKRLLERLLGCAVRDEFATLPPIEGLAVVQQWFAAGGGVEVSDAMPASEYREALDGIEGLGTSVHHLTSGEEPAMLAASIEFLLEGLHLTEKLNKQSFGTRADKARYGDTGSA